MLESLRQRLARAIAPSQVRRFDAAAGGRRASGFGAFGRTSSEVSAAAYQVRSRARYLAANNPHVANAVANWVASLVGTGITPTGNADQVARFNAWGDVADAEGRTDFAGLQEQVARALVIDGEVFLRFRVTAGIRLQLLPAEMIDESRTVEHRDGGYGGYTVNGVEFDSDGVRVAYWVLPVRPTDQFASYHAPVRVDASEILHIFKPIGIGQVRGISWLAPIVVPASEFDAIVDALAVGVKVAALNCGFITDQNGSGGVPYDGEQTGSILDSSLEPGVVRVLPAGWDIKFNSPQQANETAAFLRFNLQMLAAGLGLPEHMLSGDLSQANYSSLRAGLLPFRARCEQIQYGVLVPQFLNPVWRRVQFIESLAGAGDAPASVEWLPPRWAQVDPLKDTQATVAEIEAGLNSRAKAVAERGWNIETLDAEIAADRLREATLGLSFRAPAASAKESPANV